MSFILDALKKSELERQRQAIPGLVETPIGRPKTGLPWWAIALGILLAVNLLAVTWMLLHNALTTASVPAASVPAASVPAARSEAAAQTTASAPAGAPAGGGGRPADHFSPLDPAPEYAPEIPVPSTAPRANVTPPPTPLTAISPSVTAANSHPHEPLLTDDDYRPSDNEVLPTINELSLSGSQALPELHLDVHVYATKPAERFVYINMRKYHEGATLEEGPVIERIRRDGVVLNYQGLRFLLPRQ
jgi:general secretion pathway protein B